MSSTAQILSQLAAVGVSFRVDGERLLPRGPREVLTPQLIGELRARKHEIVGELKRQSDAGRDASDSIGMALSNLPPARRHEAARLLQATRDFLAGPHWGRALKLDWSLSELFGLDTADVAGIASAIDTSNIGLIPWLALARPGRLAALEEDHAVVDPHDERLTSILWPRRAGQCLRPWWQSAMEAANHE